MIGGINIANHYAGTAKAAPWLDFAVVVSGPVCGRLELICRERWRDFNFKKSLLPKKTLQLTFADLPIRVRRNDFIRNQNEIAITYRQGIRRAQESLTLVGGYFLPGGRTRRLLRAAVRRGVDVKVLVAEKSDVGIMVNARKYLYSWLARNGIHVYEYHSSNVHGKVLIVDKKWATIFPKVETGEKRVFPLLEKMNVLFPVFPIQTARMTKPRVEHRDWQPTMTYGPSTFSEDLLWP